MSASNTEVSNFQIDLATIQPFPQSKKIYVTGSRSDIRVPMREVSLEPTSTQFGGETNPAVYVYDTSGPYTDPQVTISLEHGKQRHY